MTSEPTFVRLIRHGKVAAKHRASFYGGAEVPLSEGGLAASLELVQRLSAEPVDRIVSSPLERARLLAEALAAATGAPHRIDKRFVELDRGRWTHVTRDELERTDPGAIGRYLADPERHSAPGGERESDLCARVWGALDDLVATHPGARFVVVCHGHVIRAAMRRLTGLDAAASLRTFVPYLGIVDLALHADGTGRILAAPEPELPEALR